MKNIRPGIYRARGGWLIAVLAVRPSGFIEGRALSWKESATWAPGGRWIGLNSESPLDLIERVGDFA